jgi:hypothetical protein
MVNLGLDLERNGKKLRNGFTFQVFGIKLFVPRRLFLFMMKNKLIRRLGLLIKTKFGAELKR